MLTHASCCHKTKQKNTNGQTKQKKTTLKNPSQFERVMENGTTLSLYNSFFRKVEKILQITTLWQLFPSPCRRPDVSGSDCSLAMSLLLFLGLCQRILQLSWVLRSFQQQQTKLFLRNGYKSDSTVQILCYCLQTYL